MRPSDPPACAIIDAIAILCERYRVDQYYILLSTPFNFTRSISS